jgi:hypothetical protein
MEKKQLRKLIKETLIEIGLYSQEAENLIIGTIAQESHLGKYIEQVRGPAKGICQMEPNTYNDIWNNYLKYKPELSDKILKLSVDANDADEMRWNLKLSIAMCRVHYLRVPTAIPLSLERQAEYWKKFYNTRFGKGTIEQYIKNYNRFVQ